MNWPLFASVFAVTFVAELPDKTAFAALLLASRRGPWAVFFGAAAAFAVQTMVAVTCGRFLGLLPGRWVRLFAGVLFLGLAAVMALRKEQEEGRVPSGGGKTGFWEDASASFVVIFIAEWGDLTQFSTAALVARTGDAATVFASAVLALWTVTALAVALGAKAKAWLKPPLLKKMAAACFAAAGLVLLCREF